MTEVSHYVFNSLTKSLVLVPKIGVFKMNIEYFALDKY